MKYYIHTLICLFCLFGSSPLLAQTYISSMANDEQLYKSHVKSLDEFIQRINGKELHPYIQDEDSLKVRKTRLSLFDMDLLRNIEKVDSMPPIYEDFVDCLERDSIAISLEDKKNWIEAKCRFKWDNSDKNLTLKMQLDKDSLGYWRWSIVDIVGLEDCELLNDKEILRISPVEHEMNYIELESLFKYEYTRIANTRMTGVSVDRLSYFYGLVFSGRLKYDLCESVEFHCQQIPGYYFVVKELNRLESANSGWLIISLNKYKYE